jgi:hypothetical protein
MPDVAEPDPRARALIESAAEDALVTLLVRPSRWAPVRDALAPLLPELRAAAVKASDTPWGVPAALGLFDISLAALPSLDASEDFALGLFVSDDTDLIAKLEELAGSGRGLRALRHRVILPARDPHKLAAELRALAKSLGAQLIDEAGADAAPLIAVHPEEGQVRIEVVPAEVAPGSTAA